jgi:polar amino acid transport system substrate-binding protein
VSVRHSRFALVAAASLLSLFVLVPREVHADKGVSLSAAQVSSGSKLFAQNCASCHGAALEGGAGPPLSGPNFKTLSSKVHATVGDIFSYMTSNMPMNAPASLKHDQYVAIMAFILSKNGYHPNSSALTYSAAMQSKAPIQRN